MIEQQRRERESEGGKGGMKMVSNWRQSVACFRLLIGSAVTWDLVKETGNRTWLISMMNNKEQRLFKWKAQHHCHYCIAIYEFKFQSIVACGLHWLQMLYVFRWTIMFLFISNVHSKQNSIGMPWELNEILVHNNKRSWFRSLFIFLFIVVQNRIKHSITSCMPLQSKQSQSNQWTYELIVSKFQWRISFNFFGATASIAENKYLQMEHFGSIRPNACVKHVERSQHCQCHPFAYGMNWSKSSESQMRQSTLTLKCSDAIGFHSIPS